MVRKIDFERALKDEAYYNGLTAEEKAQVPRNPAGDSELAEKDLDRVSGGLMMDRPTTKICHSDRTKITGCGACPA